MSIRILSILSFSLLLSIVPNLDGYAEGGHPIMPLSEVQKGMSGHGMSVFTGTEPKAFQFEVIGKLKNRLPKQSLIIVRLSGQNLEHSGTIAGMSGSPLYINDRLIGAVSYAWGFAKDPIAGVTPIENMLGDLERDSRTSEQLLARQRAKDIWSPYLADRDLSAALKRLGASQKRNGEEAMTSIALPITLPPMEADLEEIFKSSFAGSSIVPVIAGGAASEQDLKAAIPPIVPGGVLGIAFLTGDVAMAGVGTITDVVGQRLIGFGHPMMQVGATDVPMLASKIITVLANQKLSFKMATAGPIFGQLTGDFQASVVGDMTRRTKMVPISIRFVAAELGVDETYEMEATPMPAFFPMAVVSGFSSAAHNALPHALTFQYKVSVRWGIAGVGEGVYSNYVLSSDPKEAVRHVVLQPLIHALSNPYQDVRFTKFDVEVEALPKRNLARIVGVHVPVAEARVDEEVSIRIELRPFGTAEKVVKTLSYRPKPDQVGQKITLDVASAVRLEKKVLPQHQDMISYMRFLKPVAQHNELALRVREGRTSVDADGVLYPQAPMALKAAMENAHGKPSVKGIKGQFVKKVTQEWLLDGEASVELKVLPAAR